MGRDPFMIRDFARFIQRDYEQRGIPDVMVRAFVLCSMNGRKPQLMIDPEVDLTQETLPPNWIIPLEADLGGDWNQPVAEWEELIMPDPIHPQLSRGKPPTGESSSQKSTSQSNTNG